VAIGPAMMNEPEWPGTLPIALAFEVVRQQRIGAIKDPRHWLETIVGQASPATIIAEAEAQLAGDRPVDLSDWVVDDMPSHEARFIDDRSDLIRATLICSLYAIGPGVAEPRLSLGDTLAVLRDAVFQELQAIERDQTRIADEYGLREMETKLARLRAALEGAFREHATAEVTALLEKRVDQPTAERLLRDAITREWRVGFPRSILGEARQMTTEWRSPQPYLGIRTLELKQFFTEGEIEPDTMALMGSSWARAFLESESRELLQALSHSTRPRSWRLRDVRERLTRAISVLNGRGLMPTHLVGPPDWRLWEALSGSTEFTHGPRYEDGRVGTIRDIPAYEALGDTRDVFLLSLPAAVTVEQRLFNSETFLVSVNQIVDDVLARLQQQGSSDVDGPGPTPESRIKSRALVDVREAPRFRIDRNAAIRITIPEEIA
jgi:hypothetical protein